ncbi:Na+/H+ antiporter NhaA [Parapedobacter koreensis]|nr:Na+/H+ antiporter NhaA [Parapedobacter koreensis]
MDMVLSKIKNFIHSSTGPGIILIGCVVFSLIIANSSLSGNFETLLNHEMGYQILGIQLKYPLLLWINDGLMAIFFLLVGLEIKRELIDGELASPKQAALPIIGALGGVLAPALIFTIFNFNRETAAGWATPMATDIAFALAIVTLLGDRVPLSLKVFLAALAIVDDLMAIVVIALFYATELHYNYLLYAGLVFSLLLVFNKIGIKHLAFYLIPGLVIWYFIHHSGIHATIAGVLTAFAIPAKPGKAKHPPLETLAHALSKPVNLIIMPIFALANTNITFEEGMVSGLVTPLGLGIVLGLFLGKPLGIFSVSWLSVKLGICSKPHKAQWKHLWGVGMLAGIGFTMSIFIAVLSFFGNQTLLAQAKFAILSASLLSGISGALVLTVIAKRQKNNVHQESTSLKADEQHISTH